MANIIIKRKVDLAFLGDEYDGSYLVFRAIPISEYEELMERIKTIDGDNQKSMSEILNILEKYFLDGVFNEEKVIKEDIRQFDGETIVRCFEALTGQVNDEAGNKNIDPKDEPSSTTTSTTDTDIVQK